MKKLVFIVLFIITSISLTYSQSHWTFILSGGDVYNLPVPLIIRQQGYPEIKLTAHYRTESFTLPIYMDWRISHWQKGKSWELEMIHQKLYLENTSSEVSKFNISHGFNIFTINRGFEQKNFQYRAGIGFVLAHPESIIRGQEFGDSDNNLDMGYFLTGPVLNFAISKPFPLGKRFFIHTEAKTTIAYSNIKIAQGNSDVFNVAFHLILGLGYDFMKTRD